MITPALQLFVGVASVLAGPSARFPEHEAKRGVLEMRSLTGKWV